MPDVAMSTPASVGPVRGCFVSASWSAVSFVAGHRTTQMVIRHYHKYVPNLTRRDGDALARALNKRMRPR